MNSAHITVPHKVRRKTVDLKASGVTYQQKQSDTARTLRAGEERPTLLVVDDDSENLAILTSLLRNEYGVIPANGGQQAIAVLDREQIDLILLDIQMPTINGYEVCKKLKASQATFHIPVIFVTAAVGVEYELQGFRLGAVDFVTKPIKFPVLKARIKNHLDIHYHIKALELASRTDSLTGLSNRLHLDQLLDREWLRMLRRDEPLSVIMIDLDHFKSYNDYYGHLQGDDCLKRVAGAIASCPRRPEDAVGRYGGEEFLAVLPNTGLNGAAQVAARMQQTVQHMQLPHVGNSASNVVTISLGVASHSNNCNRRSSPSDVQGLLNQADRCLYNAKTSGRNQHRVEDGG